MSGYTSEVNGIDHDEFGNVYVLGNFKGSICLDSANASAYLQSTNFSYDLFLAKYDSGGVFQWVRRMASKGDDYGRALDVVNSTHIYVTGHLASNNVATPFDFFQFPELDSLIKDLPVSNQIGNFLIRMNGNNQVYWANYLQNVYLDNMAADERDNIYIKGSILYPITVEGISNSFQLHSYNASYDIAFFKFNDITDSIAAELSGLNLSSHFLLNKNLYTSINHIQNESSEVFVFPNPAEEFITVYSPFGNHSFISIYDIFGRKMVSSSLQDNALSISTQDFASGTYIVSIHLENGIECQAKFVKN
ncbi:MAG: T9SS type A sorting domain-containing protein [Chitinophagales bacterium]|nr:T9SS type A sorting domain-containing protein [Chitinophagales bacterium]